MSNAYWKSGRRKHKAFVSVNNMEAWGLSQYGSQIYPQAYNQARHMFAEAAKLFNGTYTYETPDKDEQGNPIMKSYPNLGIIEEDLLNFYFEEYGDRLIARPFEPGRSGIVSVGEPGTERFEIRELSPSAAMDVCLDITYRKVQQFVKFNTYKYLTLVKTTGFVYNPIENYRMEENGSDSIDYSGDEVIAREAPKTLDSKGWEVQGVVEGFNQGQSGAMVAPTLDIDHTHSIKIAESNASSSKAGASGGNAGTVDGSTPSAKVNDFKDGETVSTKNYTTTYDDAGESRLRDYSTTTGETASHGSNLSHRVEDEEVIGRIWGGTNIDPYTDTKSFEDRNDTKTHNLTRSGNIGVTTSQQMIESERELANFNIVRQFCEELNKEILLEVYDSGVPTEVLVDLFNSET